MGTAFLSGQSGGGFPAGWKEEVAAKIEGGMIAKYDAVLNYTKSFESVFTKLSNPAVLPSGYPEGGVCFSPDGVYLVVATAATPYIHIYKRSGDTFTKLSNPATLPSGYLTGCSWSSDGTYLAITSAASPYLLIYKRSGDIFTKLSNPTDLPTNVAYDVGFSSDGIYLYMTWAGGSFYIYKRSGDTFTKLSNPATLPSSSYYARFSPDGVYLVIATDNTPYIYKRSGDVFTKLAVTLDTIYNPQSRPIEFSPDSRYLILSNGNYTPTIYKISNDVFTKITPFTTESSGLIKRVVLSKDGSYIAGGGDNGTRLKIYRRHNDLVEKITLAGVPTSNIYGLDFSSDGIYLAVGMSDSPFISVYKTSISNYSQPLPLPRILTYANQKVGLAKEAGAVGATIKTNVFSKLDSFI